MGKMSESCIELAASESNTQWRIRGSQSNVPNGMGTVSGTCQPRGLGHRGHDHDQEEVRQVVDRHTGHWCQVEESLSRA